MTTGNFNTDVMPNPYDYQSITLDPNVTQEDLDNLTAWLTTNKDLLTPNVTFLNPVDPDLAVDGSRWLLGPIPHVITASDSWDETKRPVKTGVYTIVDGTDRVGVVCYVDYSMANNTGSIIYDNYSLIQWCSWVPDHNYSVRGIMKMLDMLLIDKKIVTDLDNIPRISSCGWNINDFDMDTIQKLKMVLGSSGIYYEFKNNFWWNEHTNDIWDIYNKIR